MTVGTGNIKIANGDLRQGKDTGYRSGDYMTFDRNASLRSIGI